MNQHRRILNIIAAIRDSHPSMVDIYTLGSCINFFLILHNIFPNAVAYYNSDHVITEIDGKFYDINGVVKNRGGYDKISNMYRTNRVSRKFTQMQKAYFHE